MEDVLKTIDYGFEQIPITDDKLGENHVFFLPYLMGERSPINDTNDRGTFIGMLGSIDANQGDYLLGWDTDEFPFNVYETTMCTYEVLKAGGLTGGFNFDAKNRRPSYTHEDMFHAYILGMDAFALGLLKAARIIEDGRVDSFIADRYNSFGSGRQEYLESVVNNILFT